MQDVPAWLTDLLRNKYQRDIPFALDVTKTVLLELSRLELHDPNLETKVKPGLPMRLARELLELNYIKDALSRNGGNISKASKHCDISRASMHLAIIKYSLEPFLMELRGETICNY